VGNFGKYFLGWLDLSRDFFSIQTISEDSVVVLAYPGRVVLRIKYNQTCLKKTSFFVLYHLLLSRNFLG